MDISWCLIFAIFRLTLCGKTSTILLITNEKVLPLNLETTVDHISSPLNDGSRTQILVQHKILNNLGACLCLEVGWWMSSDVLCCYHYTDSNYILE